MKVFLIILSMAAIVHAADTFEGKHYRGNGDVEYLQLLDISRRMFEPDPEFLNLSMLYEPKWNGLVEGPTWDAWWVQNSYGTTYAALPFLQEPFVTFLQNSQDLWFDQMGDGKRVGKNDWVGPDGCLCDAAAPGLIYYRQGDGKTGIHDWGMEFTAAGVVMQSELLLISRDKAAIEKYLPKLERCVNFIESRRDPKNGLFLGGPACNLLAPSFAGYKKPDGTYDKAYHAGLQVTYIAAMDRLIELEKLARGGNAPDVYVKRRDAAKASLPQLITDEGYFINSIDPDGTKHGVFGAPKHGYFESSVNHDAIALRIADDAQAEKIYRKIASISGLRPHAFIVPNFPSYDDMYQEPKGLWEFGRWVNGGHWSTCEARMILAYYRLGKYEDVRASMKQLMKFAKAFRMDNPLTNFGDDVYQPNQPINITYDAFGPPAAMIRGLFEYIYTAEGLTIVPHVPPRILEMEQWDPIRLGSNRIYISTFGSGPITSVVVDGKEWKDFTSKQIKLLESSTQTYRHIFILFGGETFARDISVPKLTLSRIDNTRIRRLSTFYHTILVQNLPASYEREFAGLCENAIRASILHGENKSNLTPASTAAAKKLYEDTMNKLFDGFDALMKSYEKSDDATKKRLSELWMQSK